jgi:hypothetical protein
MSRLPQPNPPKYCPKCSRELTLRYTLHPDVDITELSPEELEEWTDYFLVCTPFCGYFEYYSPPRPYEPHEHNYAYEHYYPRYKKRVYPARNLPESYRQVYTPPLLAELSLKK